MTRFEVLGPVRLGDADGMTEPAGRLQRVLLAVLLARANQSVSVDVLADAMWHGQRVARATQKVQFHVHKLRRLLDDPARLSFGPSGYRLVVGPDELDVERFGGLVRRGIQLVGTDPERAARLLGEALDCWRGAPYEGLDVPVLAAEAARLGDQRLAATEAWFEAELACGRHVRAVAELTSLVAAHPLRERLAGLLMTALYRDGRQAEALEVYRRTRRALIDELGLEPGPALRAVERQVLTGEPAPAPTAPERVVPAQLPRSVHGFVGRDTELAELVGALGPDAEPAPVQLVVGTAGVGKTALAVRWTHLVRDRFPDGQLYVDLRGYGPEDPVAPADALAGLLRALGVEGGGIPQELAERAARFRTLVAGRRVLVVLDNARTEEQVRPLLPGDPSAAVMVTSRDMLPGLVVRDGAHRVVLDRLGIEDSVALLRGLTGTRLVDSVGEATAMAELCARLPLALRIAAELVCSRPASSPAQLLEELVDEKNRLDLFGVAGDPHTAVRATFARSYQHLPTLAARLFRLLGAHPGTEIDGAALAAMAAEPLVDTLRAMAVLVRSHLVDEVSHHRYRTHDLLRVYATELVATEPDRAAAQHRLFNYYRYAAAVAMDVLMPAEANRRPEISPPPEVTATFASAEDARHWLDTERANLVAVAVRDPDGSYAICLSRILWRYVEMGGYLDEAIELHSRALAEARARGDLAQQADALRCLGFAYRRQLRADEARACNEQALELYVEVGDLFGQAAVLNNLATAHASACRYRAAVPLFERVLELFDRMDRPRPAVALTNFGAISRFVGDHDRAVELVQQALDTATDNGDRFGQAYATHHLGVLAEYVGDYATAREYGARALELAREVGVHVLAVDVVNHLGNVHRGLGEHELAFEHHQEALASARINDNDRLAAQAENGLGETHLAVGDPAAAARQHQAALVAASACDSPYEAARAHTGLGDAHARLGRLDAAREHWELARDIHATLGTPEEADLVRRLAR